MSLLSALQQAKDAAAHAKPFMKLMDALTALDAEVRAAEKLVKDTDEAAARKAQLEAEIPVLAATHGDVTQAIKEHQSQMTLERNDFIQHLCDQQKAADEALAAKHAEIKAAHDSDLAILRAQIGSAQKELIDLDKQKTDMQAEIDTLRQAVQKAHSAINA